MTEFLSLPRKAIIIYYAQKTDKKAEKVAFYKPLYCYLIDPIWLISDH